MQFHPPPQSSFWNLTERPDGKRSRRKQMSRCSGMSLVELMIAFSLFTLMSLGALRSLLQTRKMSEDNVAQATAAVIAQGIIEQVQLNPYADITDTVGTPNLDLKFTGTNTNNLASIQQYSLPWASDSTTFTDIGARVDPTDPTSAVKGVLLDFEYKAADGTTIRTARYMKMRVNITRSVHDTDDNVEIILTYSWQPPSRVQNANGFITREIRTVRSETPSY